MGQALVFEAPKQIGYVTEEDRSLGADEVRVRTLFSGISAGTELTAYRGTNPYLHKRWDKERRLFLKDAGGSSAGYPLVGWGYEEVGEVSEAGAESGLRPGQRLYGIWGHRSAQVLKAEYARARLLPEGLDPMLGVFHRIGEISMNAILDAGIRLGETVAVFGLGVIGQVISQLARLSGARVVAVDLLESRREAARKLGAEVVDAGAGSAAEAIKELTGGRGADVVIEVTGATPALNEAIRAAAYSSKVVAVGFYQGEGKGLHLGEEFHHNRIEIVCSQISGVTPTHRHRWDALRLASTFMGLVADGRVELKPLITHVAPFAEAAALFQRIDARPDEVLQAVLSFDRAAA